MGSACCCLRDDWDDFANLNSSIYRNCACLHCFLQNFLFLYASLFHRGEERALPSSTQGTASLSSTASLDNSLDDMFRPPPRPLPYDADPRYFRLQRDGLVSRRDKGSSHAHEETEPLRTSEDDEESEPVSKKNKWNEFTCDEASKEYNSKSSLKLSTAKPATGFAHIYTSSEDEDVCPTCLEEYTKENPKIVTNCSHHFHLGCIYEWMERSDNCPVCGQVMAFDETHLKYRLISGRGRKQPTYTQKNTRERQSVKLLYIPLVMSLYALMIFSITIYNHIVIFLEVLCYIFRNSHFHVKENQCWIGVLIAYYDDLI